MAERLSRQALYNLVWSEPMRTLAARFGISDVALKKTCAKANIPTPNRGYWAQRETGKDVEPEPLPERPPGMGENVLVAAGRRTWYEEQQVERQQPLTALPEFATPITAVQERIAESIGKVVVPREARSWRPAIERLLANDEKRREKQRESPYPSSWNKPLFETPLERRRLRILNTLGFALAKVDGRICMSNDGRSIWFAIHQQEVSITLERSNAKPNRSLALAAASSKPQEERLQLCILKRGGSGEARATWQDDEAGKLETRLTEIAIQIGLAAEITYREHEVWDYGRQVKRKAELEEAERRRRLEAERLERERREKLEGARVDRLLKDARAFEQADLIRKYVVAIQAAQVDSASAQSEQFDRWVEWAHAQAERIDPALGGKYLTAMHEPEEH